MKQSQMPMLTPEAAAAAHQMTAHVLEKEAKRMSEDGVKHATAATGEGQFQFGLHICIRYSQPRRPRPRQKTLRLTLIRKVPIQSSG